MKSRATLRIGIPRVLNQYTCNPIFSAYFESLGIPAENLVYSDYTSEELYKAGAKRGSIDPCFPSKVGIPHVHNLLYVHHKKKPLDIIFFPMIDDLPSRPGQRAEPSRLPHRHRHAAATKAAFTKESDLFKEIGVVFLNPLINCGDARCSSSGRCTSTFKDILGLSPEENHRAIAGGLKAMDHFNEGILRKQGREILEEAGSRRRHRHRPAGAPVPQRSRHEPRDPRGVPEARLSGAHAGLAADRRRHHLAAVRRRSRAGR